MLNYSNPRMEAIINDWPMGRDKRVTATFRIEQDKRGNERAVRTTVGKPKALTYASKARIVDGDDGRTYIANLHTGYASITIMRGDMKFQHEVIFERDPRFAAMLALFEDGGTR